MNPSGAYQLPAGWRFETIPQLVDDVGLFVDGDWIETKDQDPDGDVRLIQLGDIGDGEFRDRSHRFLTSAKARELGCTFLSPGDVLIARMPDPLGRACIFPGDERPCVTAVDVCIVRSAADTFNHRWLMWFVNAPPVRAAIAGLQAGSTRKRISRKNLGTIPLPVPPIAEQGWIVERIESQLTRLDAGVAALKRAQSNLKRYRGAVLKAACEGRLVPTEAELARREGRPYEPASVLLARIKTDRANVAMTHRPGSQRETVATLAPALSRLPEGWAWTTVDQIAEVVRGASPRPAGDPRFFGGDIPWITVGPLTADNDPFLRAVPTTVTQAGRERSRYVEAGTLLLTNSGATLGVPKITLIGGCMNDGVAALLGLDYPLKLFLLYYLRSLTERLRGINQGAAQPNLNTTIIKAIAVPLAPLAEQQRIVADVERRLSLADDLERAVTTSLKRAAHLRQSVLRAAFCGRLGPPAEDVASGELPMVAEATSPYLTRRTKEE